MFYGWDRHDATLARVLVLQGGIFRILLTVAPHIITANNKIYKHEYQVPQVLIVEDLTSGS